MTITASAPIVGRHIEPRKPLATIIDTNVNVTEAEMAERVVKTRAEHGDLLQRYHEVWYNAAHTWHYLHFLGVGMMKCPNDIWMYQQLITEYKPRTIIETGTYKGGSALWYATILDMLQIDGHVYTVDIDDYRECSHPRVTFVAGDSTDEIIVKTLAELIERPLMVILDSDHSAQHVKEELDLYAPLVDVGEWLIVEDTNISWPGDRGARGGLEDYLRAHEGEFTQDVLSERWLLTMNPGGWLRRVAK